MEQSEMVRRLEAIERKIKLMYYIDAERMVADLLCQLGRVREDDKEERPFLIPKPKEAM
jgi:hypothetical protein